MSLPTELIDDVFKVLLAEYGQRFVRMYAGQEDAMPEIKARWAEVLGGVKPAVIRYGLRHLPEKVPPTPGEFRALCLNAPPPEVKALPAPRPDRKRLAAEFAKLRETIRGERDPRAWIRALEARVERGEALTETQRAALQRASYALPAEMPAGEFTPIPADCLPPGMRGEA